jgi:hypothetical protein
MQRFMVKKRYVFINKYVDWVKKVSLLHVRKHDGVPDTVIFECVPQVIWSTKDRIKHKSTGHNHRVETEQNTFIRISNVCVTNDYRQNCEFSIPSQEVYKEQTIVRALESALSGKLDKKTGQTPKRVILINFVDPMKYALLKELLRNWTICRTQIQQQNEKRPNFTSLKIGRTGLRKVLRKWSSGEKLKDADINLKNFYMSHRLRNIGEKKCQLCVNMRVATYFLPPITKLLKIKSWISSTTI